MALFNLSRLKRAKGNRRKVVKFMPLKPALADRRELEAIMLEAARWPYAFRAQLLEALARDREDVFTDAAADDIDRIINLIVTQTNAVMVRLELRIREWAATTDARHRKNWKAAMKRAIDIDADTLIIPGRTQETVQRSVVRNVSLARDLSDEARKRIADLVIAGVQNRRPPVDVAKDIAAAGEMSRKRALNIAMDQANKLNAALDRTRQREAGIRGFTWRHSGKVHARQEHLERDGEYFEWDTPDIEPGDFPGEPPFCGCVAQATLLDTDGEEDDTDELDLEDAA